MDKDRWLLQWNEGNGPVFCWLVGMGSVSAVAGLLKAKGVFYVASREVR